jgi:hypothetical protein
MIAVLWWGTPKTALLSNYFGVIVGQRVQFRGIAPPPWFVWAFDIWLVLTSAIQWMVIAGVCVVLARFMLRRLNTST